MDTESDGDDGEHYVGSGKCIFCSKGFTRKSPYVKTPDISRLDKLFHSCKIKNDEIGKRILAEKSNYESGKTPLEYHRNCKATYQISCRRLFSEQPEVENENKENIRQALTTRSSNDKFDWKFRCFICCEKCDPKRDSGHKGYSRSWSLVETSIDKSTQSIYSKVLEAAEKRKDITMINRLLGVPNGDLVAVGARYHRKKGCLTKYYACDNIDTKPFDQRSSKYRTAALKLKDEYENQITSEKRVFLLSTLKRRFIEISKGEGFDISESYKSTYFKRLLQNIWPELSFINQEGKSDLVCSRDITVGEALQEAQELEQTLEQIAGENSEIYLQPETEESIVHKAVGVLRERVLKNTKPLKNEYYSVEEMTLQSQKEFVDPLLYKAVCWMSNNTYFNDASDCLDMKCLAIACDLTNLVTSIPSPKHLGLALHIYNDFGSRHLVEDMFNLGYSVSYSELRMFLSSAANYAIMTQNITQSGGLVPENIAPKNKGGKLIVGIADNWDHNEKTIDGKRTTHAMTSILVSPKVLSDQPMPRLQRTGNRTFDCKTIPGGSLCSITPYKKPVNRPCPFFDPPVAVEEVRPIECHQVQLAKLKELLYNFGRCSAFCDDLSDEVKTVPPWNLFQANSTGETQQNISDIAYNPIIMATPTDYSTVYTTLLRLKECMNVLGQSYAPIVFDMSLLTKALEIVWCERDELKGVIPIEGGMHTLIAVFAGIGHLYGDAGLKQLLAVSGVYAPNTVSNILAGKDFDRALVAFKLVDEVLHSCLLSNFESWCSENHKDLSGDIANIFSQVRDTGRERYTNGEIEHWCEMLSTYIIPLLNEFREESRQISPTFKLWDDYLNKVSVPLKMFISSTRSPNWSIHQFAKLSLLPLLFASNRTTYAKYMTVQVLQMKRLPDEVEEGFLDGLFTAKLAEGTFNNVWLDYTLEVTQNKSLKGSGGIIGLTLKEDALARWFLSRPIASRYSMAFHKSIVSTKDEHHVNNSTSKSKLEQYEKNISKMKSMFETGFIDPFDSTKTAGRLVNFATGVQATDEVAASMDGCLDKGTQMLETFLNERLVNKADGSCPPDKNFFSPMSKSNIKTMKELKRNSNVRQMNDTIRGETMFQRLLAVNAYKKIPPERVFSFENTMVPMSLFTEDGFMLKCKKSDFMNKLEELLQEKTYSIERADTLVIDAMAVIQSLSVPNVQCTFNDMANMFVRHIVAKAHTINGVSSVHIIFDKYTVQSLKYETRIRRGDNQTNNIHISGDLLIPKDWKDFLSNGTNKQRLAEFYTGYIKENVTLIENYIVYVSGGHGELCLKISTDSCEEIASLQSNQEEADTRIVLHAMQLTEDLIPLL